MRSISKLKKYTAAWNWFHHVHVYYVQYLKKDKRVKVLSIIHLGRFVLEARIKGKSSLHLANSAFSSLIKLWNQKAHLFLQF